MSPDRRPDHDMHTEKIQAFRQLGQHLERILDEHFFPSLEHPQLSDLPTCKVQKNHPRRTVDSSPLIKLRQWGIAHTEEGNFLTQYISFPKTFLFRGFFVPANNDVITTYRLYLSANYFSKATEKVLSTNQERITEDSQQVSRLLKYTFYEDIIKFVTDSLGTLFTIVEGLHFYAPNKEAFLHALQQLTEPVSQGTTRSTIDILSLAPAGFWGESEGSAIDFYDFEQNRIRPEFLRLLYALKKEEPENNNGGCPVGISYSPGQPSSVAKFAQEFLSCIEYYFDEERYPENALLPLIK